MTMNKLDPVSERALYMAGLERLSQFYPGHGFANIENAESGGPMKCIHIETPDGPCGGLIGSGKDADGPHMTCSKCGKIRAVAITPKKTGKVINPNTGEVTRE
jgi:hypothetical protein